MWRILRYIDDDDDDDNDDNDEDDWKRNNQIEKQRDIKYAQSLIDGVKSVVLLFFLETNLRYFTEFIG